MKKQKTSAAPKTLRKACTGIRGLDEITGGGLPAGRPTLVCGGAGCGKTLLAMEFLVRGATEHDEPGVFMTFEETDQELVENVASLGFDLKELVARKKLRIDYVYVDRSDFEETGEYDLEGLFIRLGYAIDSIKAKRVVLDTIEGLFAGLPNQAIVRTELRRLFRWLKEKSVTVVQCSSFLRNAHTAQGFLVGFFLWNHRLEQPFDLSSSGSGLSDVKILNSDLQRGKRLGRGVCG
jgi:circadian clock protein KaiC